MVGFIFVLVFCIALGVVAYVAAVKESKQRARLRNDWKFLASGHFDSVIHGTHNYFRNRRSGSMVHTSSREKIEMDITVIRFSDGRTLVAESLLGMPFPKGSDVSVYRNGLGGYKVELSKTDQANAL